MSIRVYYIYYCLSCDRGLPSSSQINSENFIMFRQVLMSCNQSVPHFEQTRTASPFTDDVSERDWETQFLQTFDVLNSSMQTSKKSPALSRLFKILQRRSPHHSSRVSFWLGISQAFHHLKLSVVPLLCLRK